MDLEEGRRVLGGLGSPADLHRRAGGSETEAKMGPDAGAPGSRAVAPRGGAAPHSPVHPSSASDRTHFANEDINSRMQSFKHGQPGGPGLLGAGACRQQVTAQSWGAGPAAPGAHTLRRLRGRWHGSSASGCRPSAKSISLVWTFRIQQEENEHVTQTQPCL